ncbi:MAG: DEAD/DEAH box helicase [Oligoflexia bacterium]|nr:DEAD/DEAH box helicase [Oligoflexia bacterium]
MSNSWNDLKLSSEALDLIEKAGFTAPTPVQEKCIPVALEGKDLIGTAQTGTGKTATFALPMVERFAGRRGTYGLVLAPTREIAQQTQATFEKFGKPRGVESIVLIGGVNMRDDDKALATYPQVIVATPGRLCDHLDRGNIWLDFIEMVVLDEADRMLDMGFADQLARVMQDCPATRQTLLFSATMTAPVEKLARKIMRDPVRVSIGAPQSTATTVEQYARFIPEERKNSELRRIIREEPGSIIVFTRSKMGATKVWRSLHSSGVYDATYIHSDRLQTHREQALAEFKEGKYRILIATDVAGRGIHVEGVAHVVNYDLPMEPEDYVHRIGRTGRAGATGRATTFVTPRDRGHLKQIEKLIGKSFSDLPEGPKASESSAPAEGVAVSVSEGAEAAPAIVPETVPGTVKEAQPSVGSTEAPAVQKLSIIQPRKAPPEATATETVAAAEPSEVESESEREGEEPRSRRRPRSGREESPEIYADHHGSQPDFASEHGRRQKTFFPIDEPPPPP